MTKKINFKDIGMILLGSTIMTVAVRYVLDPAGLVTGGVSGLSIVVKDLGARFGCNIPLWVSNVVLNIPIFLFALKTEGLRGILRALLSWVTMSVELVFFPDLSLPHDNLLLVSLYGGVLFGAGTGILLSVHATSGGTDMLASSMIHFAAGRRLDRTKKNRASRIFRQISYGTLIAILDGIVVVVGAFVFSIEHTLYALISIVVMGKITDLIVNRGTAARMLMIISEKNEEIAQTVMKELDRGVTSLHATGMYRNEDRTVLLCICGRRELVEIKDIVRQYDRNAFFVIGNVNEVLGEGFIENWS
ncbi:MAG: YitT family protein [Lachnospiraceae bacterium]|nr:YitT family protein [Lachnospiraceae bacterium]